MYPLRRFPSGHIFIDPRDDCDLLVDAMLETGYGEEFCLALDFEEGFVGRLMEAGFLVMSTELADEGGGRNGGRDAANGGEPPGARTGGDSDGGAGAAETGRSFILLPKLHLTRSALFFPELHIKKSVRRFLPRYELRVNADFCHILDKCVQTHGAGWLTPPLVALMKNLRKRNDLRARPFSFGVYRDGRLRAGEIGVATGGVYTSYSGYREEADAGTVQLILAARWLEKAGFDFFDLGMPMDYKADLGARDIAPGRFVELFRGARGNAVQLAGAGYKARV